LKTRAQRLLLLLLLLGLLVACWPPWLSWQASLLLLLGGLWLLELLVSRPCMLLRHRVYLPRCWLWLLLHQHRCSCRSQQRALHHHC
jgi:hypothetical protein